uniref:signal recognition particle receptor subunit alpha-like n=1 Tax=Styela clava TaxID=7725 RepID=UPI00193A47C9|nr:signal recognition particle receptor subunit alpha-like [Styela clava]
MLDFFTILSKGGFVLWCYTFQGIKTNISEPVNALIKGVILQERGGSSRFDHGSLTLKYKLDNEFELVFVVGYQKILSLTYIDKFIDDVHRTFRDLYRQKLENSGFIKLIKEEFEYGEKFLKMLKAAEAIKVQTKMKDFHESEKSKKTVKSLKMDKKEKDKKVENEVVAPVVVKASPKASPKARGGKIVGSTESDEVSKNREAFIQRQLGGGKKKEAPKKSEPKPKGKKARVWENGGTTKDEAAYDYSSKTNGDSEQPLVNERQELLDVELAMVGTASGAIKDLEVNEDDSDDEDEYEEEEVQSKKSSGMFGVFRGLVGSKALTKENLTPVLDKMRDHLIGKNVAADIADKLCLSVAGKLEGKVLGTFSSVASTVKQCLNESLVQILTPKRRVDILRDVLDAQRSKRPYVITFCGVNGVGKSTNLAKICFWLVENGFRVLIAACDTFRAGAVEQLRTHVARLNTLHPAENHGGSKTVFLFEKGYGKDAAGIAMQAINAARDQRYDVVLVDTAGRMQDNEPLMRSLAKLIAINSPDLVLFVGEALVGNEAVDQLVKFNQALADFSQIQNPRLIDGIVLTKFDTIDDKVGAAISMTYTTGQPIVFVGTGQSYPDLRSLNAKAIVHALLK